MAALAVVAHHAEQSANAFTADAEHHLFEWGIYGVDFFFVLSGFIIYFAHHRDNRNFQSAKRFYAKRVRRIYAPYLPIALILILGYTALPSLSQGNRDWSLFTSLTLIPTGRPPALSVAWTLIFEMAFYTIFLVFYLTRFFIGLLALWGTIVFLWWAFGIDSSGNPIIDIYLNPLVLEFIFGVFVCYAYLKRPMINLPLVLAFAFSVIFLFFLLPTAPRFVLGIGFSLIVYAAVVTESRKNMTIHKGFLTLGAASYAIYLIHDPVQSVLIRVVDNVGDWAFSFTVCVIGGFFAGLAYHFLIEKPLLIHKRTYPRRNVV